MVFFIFSIVVLILGTLGCDITNATLSAVKVGKDGSPVIANNKIHDTHEAGVAVFGGSGIIENNQFYKNRYLISI